MVPHQLFVGSVALVLGALAIGASLANYDGLFQLAKMRILEETVGRSGARLACGLLGCGLIVVGGLIVTGVLPRKMSQGESEGLKADATDGLLSRTGSSRRHC